MILIIIGVIVALRFLGQLMIAKRYIDEQNRAKEAEEALRKQRDFVEKNKGKTNLVSRRPEEPYEDVDYEEVSK